MVTRWRCSRTNPCGAGTPKLSAGAPVRCHNRKLRLRHAALVGILFSVDRPDMRRVSIEIRAPDPKLVLVRIDPLPQLFTRSVSLQTGLALDAHEIGCKPVAVAAAAAAAMVRAIARSFLTGCDRLPVIVAECAGYARHEPSVVHRTERVIELQLEATIHASDYVVCERHAGSLRRYRVFPCEVAEDVLDDGFNDGPRLALLLDRRLDMF